MKYRVYGHTTVVVVVEVDANSEEKAIEAARKKRCILDSYMGNGGSDKLIGVYGKGQSVCVDEDITYDDAEQIEEGDSDD